MLKNVAAALIAVTMFTTPVLAQSVAPVSPAPATPDDQGNVAGQACEGQEAHGEEGQGHPASHARQACTAREVCDAFSLRPAFDQAGACAVPDQLNTGDFRIRRTKRHPGFRRSYPFRRTPLRTSEPDWIHLNRREHFPCMTQSDIGLRATPPGPLQTSSAGQCEAEASEPLGGLMQMKSDWMAFGTSGEVLSRLPVPSRCLADQSRKLPTCS